MGRGTIPSLECVLGSVPSNPFWWFFLWPCVFFPYSAGKYFAKYLSVICRSLEISPCSALLPLVLCLEISRCSDHLRFSDTSLQLRDCAGLCLVFSSLSHCLEAGRVIELMSSVSHVLGFALRFLFLEDYCLIFSVLKTVVSCILYSSFIFCKNAFPISVILS